jgi:drug/metabolite transporter (DMT)-like permease
LDSFARLGRAGQAPGRAVLGGAGLGLAGVAALVDGAGALGGLSAGWSAALLLSAPSWAAGTVLGRRLPRYPGAVSPARSSASVP